MHEHEIFGEKNKDKVKMQGRIMESGSGDQNHVKKEIDHPGLVTTSTVYLLPTLGFGCTSASLRHCPIHHGVNHVKTCYSANLFRHFSLRGRTGVSRGSM